MLSNMKKQINGVNKIKIIMMERIHMIGWLEGLFEEIVFKLRLIDKLDLVRKRARRETVFQV